MKYLLIAVLLFFICDAAVAQRFYYVKSGDAVGELLKTRLEKADQYVVAAPIRSDYTVRTKMESRDNAGELNLEIVLADSVTQQEIYRCSEQFCFTNGHSQPELVYSIAIRSFVQRRIGKLIQAATQDHAGMFRQELQPRRDRI